MRLLPKKKSKRSSYNLFIKINVSKAVDLTTSDNENDKIIRCNPVLSAKLNEKSAKTSRIKASKSPNWDTTLQLPLIDNAYTNFIQISVWDKHRKLSNYLGELRLDVNEIFGNAENEGTGKPSQFKNKTDFKWYKLYSSKYQNSFVTGSVLLSFELVARKQKNQKKRIAKNVASRGNSSGSKDSERPINLLEQGIDSNNQSTTGLVTTFSKLNVSENELSFGTDEPVPEDELQILLDDWTHSLVTHKSPKPNDQGFYSDEDGTHMDTDSEDDGVIVSSRLQAPNLTSDHPNQFLSPELKSPTGYDTDSSAISLSAGGSASGYTSNIDSADTNLSAAQRGRFTRRVKAPQNDTHYELGNRDVLGVIFLEILSCSDLPPYRNATRTGFDMDPFVVVSFGRRTFRTSWKRHSLNPLFNERLAFEILPSESTYDVQLSVLDKDHFSFHDKVASILLPIMDLISEEVPESSASNNTTPSTTPLATSSSTNTPPVKRSISIIEDSDFVTKVQKKKFKKKVITSKVDTSKFRTLELSLQLDRSKYSEKYNPTLKIRTRFEPYSVLRKQFWHIILTKYDIDGNGEFDFIELLVFLETLGSNLSDDIISSFFTKYNKSPWSGDRLTIDQIVDCLEEFSVEHNDSDKFQIIKIDRCPVCGKERLSRKQDIDIITHVAICASKDWSIANKLLVSSYVTPQFATKRWYSKFLIKLTYGKYALGGNNANILVQDRTTGIIMEEKMSIYVRLGIRLLYKGLDKANSGKVRKMLKKLSIKQGLKFDSESSKNDIASFVKYHSLNTSECLLPLDQFKTFNDFFFRKLKPEARPIEDLNNHKIAVSTADCRVTVFPSIAKATELWIKGRNFTIAKLLNGNYQNFYESFENCSIGIFRLAPQDYHRFHSPVSGNIKKIIHVDGEYYTVNPMAIRSELDVFGENVRCIIPIETKEFGTVIMIPVGAMMVGSIVITRSENDYIKKGEEMGYFKFGGSTVILLFQSSFFKFDSDLILNSEQKVETLIRVGQSIGHTPDIQEYQRNMVNFNNQSDDYKLNLMRIITGGGGSSKNWETEKLSFNDNFLMVDSDNDSGGELDEEYEDDE